MLKKLKNFPDLSIKGTEKNLFMKTNIRIPKLILEGNWTGSAK